MNGASLHTNLSSVGKQRTKKKKRNEKKKDLPDARVGSQQSPRMQPNAGASSLIER